MDGDPESESKLVDFLKKEIERVGFPLEIEVAEILESKQWFYINNSSYLDPDEDKVRTIDFLAIPPHLKDIVDAPGISYPWGMIDGILKPFTFSPDARIECKKSTSHSWVFFQQHRKKPHAQGRHFGQFKNENMDWYLRFPGFLTNDEIQALWQHYWKYLSEMQDFAISYSEIKTSKQGKDDQSRNEERQRDTIFTAYSQLLKCINSTEALPASPFSSWLFYPISVSYPIIVFEGKMYAATVENGVVDPKPSEHVVLKVEYPINKSPLSEKTFLIDVVSKNALPGLCDEIIGNVRLFLKLFTENLESHRKWLTENKLKNRRPTYV